MNRKAETPRQFFDTYTGRIVCDAYPGYAALETTRRLLCGCWAHVRRKFYDAWKIGHHPEAPDVLNIIRTLYALEHEVPTEREHDPQRLSIRQQQSGPLLESLQELLEEWKPRALPSGKLGVAIGYALNNWPRLLRFLQDPTLPIDNNAVEQMIRPVAVGRNNWLFMGSETGGHAAAVYMTLLATCKRAGVNPCFYFKDILGRLMDHSTHRLDELLPGAWKPRAI
jgi:transposase